VGAYQNVTAFGFAFTWATGGVLITFSWSLTWCVKKQRKWGKRTSKAGPTARHIAWNIDGKFQQQRVALRTVGYQELEGGEDDVPFLEEEGPLPLPFSAHEEKVEGRKEADAIYIETEAINGAVGDRVEDINLPQIAPNGTAGAARAAVAAYPPPAPVENEENSQDSSITSQSKRSRISLQRSQPSPSHRSRASLTMRGSLPFPPPSRSSPNSTTTPNEATNNSPCGSLVSAPEGGPAVVQDPTREHGSTKAPHVANADASPHSPPISPPLTTETSPISVKAHPTILIPNSNKTRAMVRYVWEGKQQCRVLKLSTGMLGCISS
jgi:hypothetical protein